MDEVEMQGEVTVPSKGKKPTPKQTRDERIKSIREAIADAQEQHDAAKRQRADAEQTVRAMTRKLGELKDELLGELSK